jgi:hypothetical protein
MILTGDNLRTGRKTSPPQISQSMAGHQSPFLQFADWSLYLLSYLKALFSQCIAETEVHICFKGGRFSQRVGGLQMNCRTLRIILSEIQTKLREAAAAQRCAALRFAVLRASMYGRS